MAGGFKQTAQRAVCHIKLHNIGKYYKGWVFAEKRAGRRRRIDWRAEIVEMAGRDGGGPVITWIALVLYILFGLLCLNCSIDLLCLIDL